MPGAEPLQCSADLWWPECPALSDLLPRNRLSAHSCGGLGVASGPAAHDSGLAQHPRLPHPPHWWPRRAPSPVLGTSRVGEMGSGNAAARRLGKARVLQHRRWQV